MIPNVVKLYWLGWGVCINKALYSEHDLKETIHAQYTIGEDVIFSWVMELSLAGSLG